MSAAGVVDVQLVGARTLEINMNAAGPTDWCVLS